MEQCSGGYGGFPTMLQLRQGVLAWSGALRGFDYGSDDKQVEWEDSVGFLSVRRKEVRW